MEQSAHGKVQHCLTLKRRNELEITGVTDVISFDETGVILTTEQGILSVDGTELHISALCLDEERVSVTGNINGIIYPESSVRGGFFKRKAK